ncbi:MAG: RNA-binding cell elongation regulator Jag/EloR [Sphaerochaetaceae bacterium]
MIKEFEGKTEHEAINKAIEELDIDRSGFDVEIIDSGKKGLFRKNPVKIRVHVNETGKVEEKAYFKEAFEEEFSQFNEKFEENDVLGDDVEEKVIQFITKLVEKMGYEVVVSVLSLKGNKLTVGLESENSSILIGRKGKNLDAIQILSNIFASNFNPKAKIIIDCENYRVRHEERIIREAYRTAQQVGKTGRSQLLEPMNPFERRLVHTALNDVTGIETKSEGEGLYKQVRILSVKKN